MSRRYFNWKLAIAILLGILVMAIAAFGLRQWRRTMRAESGLVLGNKAYEEHKYEEAARQFGRYLSIHQNDVAILLKYADSQIKIRPLKPRNLQQAIAAYRSVLRLDEANLEAATELAGLYLQISVPGEAELIAKRYCELNKDPKVRRILALAYTAQRKFEQAAIELQEIVSRDPNQVLAFEMLGRLALQRPEDFNEPAEYWFNEAVRNNPSSAMAYIVRANFYMSTKEQAKVLADLQQAEILDLSDIQVRLFLAMGFIDSGNLEQAEKHLIAVKQSEPQNPLLWQSWARLALKSKSVDKMRQVAEEGLKELSDYPWDFMLLAAELYIRTDDLADAEECIKQMNQKEILPAMVAYLEGLVADRRDNDYEAIRCWQRTIELGNRSLQARLALAMAFSRVGNTQSALQQLEILVSEMPNSFDARFALATMLAKAGRWEELEEQSRKALSISPGHLGVMLLNLQAGIQLLAGSDTSADAQVWQDIETQLGKLDQASGGALDVKFVKFQYALLRGNHTEAENVLSELKEQYPLDTKVALAEAMLLSVKERGDEALSVLSKAINKSPEATDLLGLYALLSIRLQKYSDCETLMKKLLARVEQSPVRRQIGLLLSRIYNLSGKKELAYTCLFELEQELPQDISIKRRLLQCGEIMGNPQRAQQLIEAIKSIEGEDGWQWRYEQAKLWYESGDFKQRYPQVVSILKENLIANPGDEYSRMLLADTYSKGGDFHLAASAYSEALNNRPDDIRLIIRTIAALQKINEYAQADEILARTAEQKLFHPELRRLELQSRLIQGEIEPAGQILEDMLSDDPNNAAICLSLASLKIQQHQYSDADELLTRLRNQQPDLQAAIEKQVELCVLLNETAEAIELCDEAVNKFNNAQAYVLRGRTYAMLRQMDLALKDFEQATAIEPENAQTWIAKSSFKYSAGQFYQAASDIQHAMVLEPNDLQIKKRAISMYLEFTDREMARQAVNLLDEALQAEPDDYQLNLLKARSLLAERNYPAIKQAQAVLRSITETQPDQRQAWLLLGEVLLIYEQQPSEAVGIALKGLAHNQNDKALLILKARAEAAVSPVSAILTLRGLLEQNPNDIEATLLLGEMFLTADQPQDAVVFLNKQLRAFNGTPYERNVTISLAGAMYKSGDKKGAEEILDGLYRTDPNDPRVLLTHVRLLKGDKLWDQIRQKTALWYQKHPGDSRTVVMIAGEVTAGDDEQARVAAGDILNSVLENDPVNTEALSALGMLFDLRGQSAQAAEFYRRLLELKPDNVVAMNNLAWILCGQDQYEQALALAEQGLEIAPDYIDLIDTRGLIYSRTGRLQEAVSDFSRCIELYLPNMSSRTVSCFHLGEALYKLGEREKAVNILKQAITLNEKIGGLSQEELTESRSLLEKMSKEE